MDGTFDLESYLNKGIETLVRDIIKTTARNPKESVYFAKAALASKKAAGRRHKLENSGEHIPSFLIASITESCNLSCVGCYDRVNHAGTGSSEMNSNEWGRIFTEAEELGVSAILLAGGEPMMRFDVVEEASLHPAILFPLFTNGTMLGDRILGLFEAHRNLIPIISIEGDKAQTDARRGEGIYTETMRVMDELAAKKLLFGASVTVTKENLSTVTRDTFVARLNEKGCEAIVFVEYVPVEKPELSLDEAGRDFLADSVAELRKRSDMIIISFPGDEKESGGCLAAGRGFFHINAVGGAEPCPFSPYSDTSLRTVSLRQALKSPLFTKLKREETLLREHTGGCTLFSQADYVQSLIAKA